MKLLYLFLVFICTTAYCQTKVDSISGLRTEKRFYQGTRNIEGNLLDYNESFNLRDSIKSVATYFPIINNAKVVRDSEIYQKFYPYVEFNTNGNITRQIDLISKFNRMLIENYRTIEDVERIKSKTKFDCDEYKCVKNIDFIYDSEDFAIKSKYKVKNNILYPAYDGRTISLNNYVVSPIPDPLT